MMFMLMMMLMLMMMMMLDSYRLCIVSLLVVLSCELACIFWGVVRAF